MLARGRVRTKPLFGRIPKSCWGCQKKSVQRNALALGAIFGMFRDMRKIHTAFYVMALSQGKLLQNINLTVFFSPIQNLRHWRKKQGGETSFAQRTVATPGSLAGSELSQFQEPTVHSDDRRPAGEDSAAKGAGGRQPCPTQQEKCCLLCPLEIKMHCCPVLYLNEATGATYADMQPYLFYLTS